MKRFLSILLIGLTMGLFYNNTVNWHYHQLPNGQLVEHAHPYNKAASASDTPFKKHNHSDLEYLILDLVYYSGLVILLSVLVLNILLVSVTCRYLLKPVRLINPGYYRLPLQRGPPVT